MIHSPLNEFLKIPLGLVRVFLGVLKDTKKLLALYNVREWLAVKKEKEIVFAPSSAPICTLSVNIIKRKKKQTNTNQTVFFLFV